MDLIRLRRTGGGMKSNDNGNNQLFYVYIYTFILSDSNIRYKYHTIKSNLLVSLKTIARLSKPKSTTHDFAQAIRKKIPKQKTSYPNS